MVEKDFGRDLGALEQRRRQERKDGGVE